MTQDTSSEMFDIFDEDNLPLGISKPRGLVHLEKKDWHRATHIWIVNKKHEILCQQRSLNKDANPGKWQSFFGGHLKSGETYEENAKHELEEELGIKAKTSQLIMLYNKKSEGAKHFTNVYVVLWDGDISGLTFTDNEVEKVQWMKIEELTSKIEEGLFCNKIDEAVFEFINSPSFLDESSENKDQGKAIVTICNKDYEGLLPLWLDRMLEVTNTPIYILCLDSTISKYREDECTYIDVSREGNPLPVNLPDHACAEKLRIFQHIPSNIENVLFLDLDIYIIKNFWDNSEFFSLSSDNFIACLDQFVGYKEKMEEEFFDYDNDFKMKYLPNGDYCYFNTGVFFASRKAHEELFRKFLINWTDFIAKTGRLPLIFDQNMINYCLIKENIKTLVLPLQNNCLRQYPKTEDYLLDGLPINALHFNGGTPELKISRWKEAVSLLK